VPRHPAARPRSVVATDEEVENLLAHAKPSLKLWLLLCSDLALRSGTAAQARPAHYDAARRELRLTSKKGARLTLPVTAAIEELLNCCDMSNPQPFIWQLRDKERTQRHASEGKSGARIFRVEFNQLRADIGITRRIIAHDLRRTTAVAMLRDTHDIRAVQSLLGHRSLNATIWYLDHDLTPISRSTLERIKRPAWRKEQHA
jgi:integrase